MDFGNMKIGDKKQSPEKKEAPEEKKPTLDFSKLKKAASLGNLSSLREDSSLGEDSFSRDSSLKEDSSSETSGNLSSKSRPSSSKGDSSSLESSMDALFEDLLDDEDLLVEKELKDTLSDKEDNPFLDDEVYTLNVQKKLQEMSAQISESRPETKRTPNYTYDPKKNKEKKNRKKKRSKKARLTKVATKKDLKAAGKYGLENGLVEKSKTKEVLVDGAGVTIERTKLATGDEFKAFLESSEKLEKISLPDGFTGADHTISKDGEKEYVIYPWTTNKEVQKLIKKAHGKRITSEEKTFYLEKRNTTTNLIEASLNLRAPMNENLTAKARQRRDRILQGSNSYTTRFTKKITPKDYDFLLYLSRFKFATAKHLSNLHQVREETAAKRLTKLRELGLVKPIPMWQSSTVWVVTQVGMDIAGILLPITTPGSISYALLGHSFVVNNTATNLIGGGANVLNLPEHPAKNKTTKNGDKTFGEEVVSETEMQSSLSQMRRQLTKNTFRPIILNSIEKAFTNWENMGALPDDSPEFTWGNEYFWVLYPKDVNRGAFHVPDLVVKRPRNIDGTPESIAVEIELSHKGFEAYLSTLKTFQEDDRIYKKVIWVCRNKATAKQLEQAAKEVGLWQEGRIDIVPVITRNGIFTSRDIWLI